VGVKQSAQGDNNLEPTFECSGMKTEKLQLGDVDCMALKL
jgi:hypothetical protein